MKKTRKINRFCADGSPFFADGVFSVLFGQFGMSWFKKAYVQFFGGIFIIFLLVFSIFEPFWMKMIAKSTAASAVFESVEIPYVGMTENITLVGCGWPRTGTGTTQAILEEFNYKVYHMKNVLLNKHQSMWEEVVKNPTKQNLQKAIDTIQNLGYNATIDFPTSHLCLEILDLLPNTRAFLNVRDPEKWIRSLVKNWLPLISSVLVDWWPLNIFLTTPHMGLFTALFDSVGIPYEFKYYESVFPWVNIVEKTTIDEEIAKLKFIENIDRVKSVVDEDRLLVYSVKQGLDPISKFLGREFREDFEMPFINDGNAFKLIGNAIHFVHVYFPFVFGIPILVGIYLIVKGIFGMYRDRKLKSN